MVYTVVKNGCVSDLVLCFPGHMMARIYYVAEFVDNSISVIPATWVYKDSESCLFTFWSSSKSRVIGYEIANPRWMTYQIKRIVAKLGKSKTMIKDV